MDYKEFSTFEQSFQGYVDYWPAREKKPSVNMYWDALKRWSFTTVISAFNELTKTEDYFPSIKKVIGIIPRSPQNQPGASEPWTDADRAKLVSVAKRVAAVNPALAALIWGNPQTAAGFHTFVNFHTMKCRDMKDFQPAEQTYADGERVPDEPPF